MRLTELEPEWVCDATPTSYRRTESFADAQGLLFACPAHFKKNGGLVGTHMILIWFADRGAPAECWPKARWRISGGDSFENLSVSPSIDLTRGDPDEWHGFITNGEITNA